MGELFNVFMDFRGVLLEGIMETLYMTFFSVAIAYVIGLPLGIFLYITQPDGIMPQKIANTLLSSVINIIRSIPFLIIIIILIPMTRAIIGTGIGSTAAIVPLVFAAAPFIARMVEQSLNELDKGVIDAARAMGATKMQIILKVMIPESIPSLIRGLAITTIMLISFSAMAGAVGAGGLGRIAIRYGYQRFMTDVMVLAIIIIVSIVGIIQFLFNTIAKKIDHRV